MNGLRVLAFSVLALAVGLVAYQMGLSQGLATTLPAGAAPAAYYYPHWGYGFGFFGFLFPLFFLFLFFGAMRAAFGGGRGGYGRGWGNGRKDRADPPRLPGKPTGTALATAPRTRLKNGLSSRER